MRFGKISYISFFILLILLSSCKKSETPSLKDSPHISLNNSIYWALASENDTVSDVMAGSVSGSNGTYEFKSLDNLGTRNLRSLVGGEGAYVWLKMEFTIPEMLKNQDLGLCVDYIHFADKVWINGNLAGEYGEFSPNFRSALFMGHHYDFPKIMLNQEGKNTILIKVYCLGFASINGDVLLGSKYFATLRANRITMYNSTVYMLFSGSLIVVFIFYLLMFIHNRKMKEFLSFSLLGLSTFIFSSIFFISQIPVSTHPAFSYFVFYKISVCAGAILIIYFFTSFVLNFLRVEITIGKKVARVIYLHALLIFVLAVPDYLTLMNISLPATVFALGQIAFCTMDFFKAFKTKEGRRHGRILLFSLIPLFLTITFDIIYLGILHGSKLSYMTYFGWHTCILAYFTILANRYSRATKNFEQLNKKLESQVSSKTETLKVANDVLENELRRSRADMRMAAIVQQKFFPYPSRTFMGWDMAVYYRPLAEVSGDLFDYYSMGSMLDGLALFDVSGHGIAAGLITMLSKNIIYQAFMKSRFGIHSASTIMKEINLKITEAKGNVENYLTGIICRFSHFEDDESCTLEMANAGHPNPIMYGSRTGKAVELEVTDKLKQFGAIGLMGRNVAFEDISAKLYESDILVFYTDGLTETENDAGEAFGKERIKKILEDNHNSDAHRIMDAITNGMKNFMNNRGRTDDLTIIVMKRQSSKDYLQEI